MSRLTQPPSRETVGRDMSDAQRDTGQPAASVEAPEPRPGGRWVWVPDDKIVSLRSRAKSRVYNRDWQRARRAGKGP